MELIKFKAKIKNGRIEIPKKYLKRLGKEVKVLVVNEDDQKQNTFIDQLLNNPIILPSFRPLRRNEIYAR